MRRRCIDLVVLCGASTPLTAQLPSPAPPPGAQLHADSGAVVRLHFVTGGVMAGRLLSPFAPDSTTWVYCPYGTSFCRPGVAFRRLVTPASAVATIDFRKGSEVGSGLLKGAGFGVAAALVLCGVEHVGQNSCSWKEFPGTAAPVVIGAAALGSVVGMFRPHWRRARAERS